MHNVLQLQEEEMNKIDYKIFFFFFQKLRLIRRDKFNAKFNNDVID